MPNAFVRLADRAVEGLAVLMTLALLTVVVLGVVSRAFNDPFVWTDELARYLMVWVALLGWSIAARRRSHIRITLVMDLLRPSARRWLEVLMQICVAVFGVLLARDGLTLVGRNWDIEATSMPMLSASFIYAPLLICGVVVALQALAQAYEAATARQAPAIEGGRIL